MGKDLNGKELGVGITQRKDGKYMARYVDRYRKRHTIYDNDVKALRRKLEKAKYETTYGIGGVGTEITLTEWFEEFMGLYKVGKVKETTVYRIRQTYSPCKRNTLGMMRLKDIRAIHVQELINKLDLEGFSYGTLSILKALLKELFRTAMGNGYVIVNPCDAVILPKREVYEARYLTEEEQQMFLEAARDYYHYDIYCFCLSCGARIGEVLGLKWDDIDFEQKTISIQRTLHYGVLDENESCHFFFTSPKTKGSERTIPLLPSSEGILKRVRKVQLMNKKLYEKKWSQEEGFEGMVFTSKQGAPIRYGDVNRSIKNAIVKANLQEEELAELEGREPYILKPFSPHCFRHTFITTCKRNGVPYETLQPYVGHSTKEMTEYYNHHKEEMDVELLGSIDLGVI